MQKSLLCGCAWEIRTKEITNTATIVSLYFNYPEIYSSYSCSVASIYLRVIEICWSYNWVMNPFDGLTFAYKTVRQPTGKPLTRDGDEPWNGIEHPALYTTTTQSNHHTRPWHETLHSSTQRCKKLDHCNHSSCLAMAPFDTGHKSSY